MNSLGIEFLYYLPDNIFVSFFTNEVDFESLLQYNVVSVNKILSDYKVDLKLKQDSFPEWCIINELLQVKLLIFSNIKFKDIEDNIKNFVESIDEINEDAHYITVAINPVNLNLISKLNYISYIEPINPPPTRENMTGRTLHRTNVINVEYLMVGYNGEGVNIMMHDDGYVQPHIDRKGRIDSNFVLIVVQVLMMIMEIMFRNNYGNGKFRSSRKRYG